jgi:hypothetical protein
MPSSGLIFTYSRPGDVCVTSGCHIEKVETPLLKLRWLTNYALRFNPENASCCIT